MSAISIVEQIIKDVAATKAQGHDNISTDKLLTYLGNINSEEHHSHEEQMEVLKSTNTAKIEEMKLNHATEIEVFKSVITVGANAAKAGMLINGGAAVSLLAFLGNIWNKSTSPTAFSSLTLTLLYFVLGVLCAGACTGFTYLSQVSYGNSRLDSLNGSFWIWGMDCLCIDGAAVRLILKSKKPASLRVF